MKYLILNESVYKTFLIKHSLIAFLKIYMTDKHL